MDLTLDDPDSLVAGGASQLTYMVVEVLEDGIPIADVFTYTNVVGMPSNSGLVVEDTPWNALRADFPPPNPPGIFTGIVGKTYTVRLSATHPALTALGLASLTVDVVVNCDRNHIIDANHPVVMETPENEALPNIAFELSDVILNAAHFDFGTFFSANAASISGVKVFKGVADVTTTLPTDTTLVDANFQVSLTDGTLTLMPSDAIALAEIDYETIDKIEMTVDMEHAAGGLALVATTIMLEYHITDVLNEIYLTSAADPKTIDYSTDE